MMLMLGLYVWIFSITVISSSENPLIRSKGYQDYCEAQSFHAQCNMDEVVVMSSALYGRMQVGRCVTKDYGFVGCEADALQHMDSQCSGRRECEVRIPDQSLDKIQTCPDDFRSYLNASYDCYQILQPRCQRESCVNATVIPVHGGSGFLASVTVEDGCGTGRCPWLLQVLPGQRINLTLLDFSTKAESPVGADRDSMALATQFGLPDFCYRLATIRESTDKKPTVLCGANQREQHAYLSTTHAVQINVTPTRQNSRYFILQYTVIGCPDYVAPEYMWAELVDDHVTVTCQSSGNEKVLYCRGNEWVGEIEHCLAPSIGNSLYGEDGSILPMGILIAVIVAIALIIGIVILTLGLVVIKRRRLAQSANTALAMTSSAHHRGAKEGQYNTVARQQPLYQSTKPCQYTMQQHHQQQQQRQQQQQYNEYLHHQQNLYDYKMKMRPLPGVPPTGSTMTNEAPNDQQGFSVPGEQAMMMEEYQDEQADEINTEDFSSIKSDDVESLCEDAPHYFELESNGPSRRQRAVPPPLPVSDGTVPPPLPAPALHYQPSVTIASIPQSPHALLPAGHIPHGAVPVTVAMPMSVTAVPVGISGVPVGVAMPYQAGIKSSGPLPPPKPARSFSIPAPPPRVTSPDVELCHVIPGVIEQQAMVDHNGVCSLQRQPIPGHPGEREPSISGNYSW